MFEVIVCDPDDGSCENNALGILYTAVSRATTLGDSEGKHSAIYFMGEHMNERRITRLGLRKNSCEEYKRVIQRREWVKYLDRRKRKCTLSQRRIKHVLKWAESTSYNWGVLSNRIEKYVYDHRSHDAAPLVTQKRKQHCSNKKVGKRTRVSV